MKSFISIIAAAFLLFAAIPALACDFCLLSQGISPLDTMKGSGIKISERYSLLDKVYQGTSEKPNPGASETHWTTEFTGFYGMTPDLTFLAIVPYKYGRTTGDPDMEAIPPLVNTLMAGSASGLGDIALLARYSFLKNETSDATTILAAVGGVKFPTGKTDAKTRDGLGYLDSHLQPGTGSTDFLLGLSLSHAVQRLSLSANVLGTITSDGKFGDTEHRFGNTVNYDVTGKYRVAPEAFTPQKPQFFVALGLNGEYRGREQENYLPVIDSGGNTIYLSPGVQLVFAPNWVIELSYQRAVYHNLYGEQLGETYKVITGVTYLF